MDVRSAMYNVDPATGERAYLSVGASALPSIYFLFFLAYAALAASWIAILLRKRAAVFRIHYFMLAVLVLKALNLLAEAEDKFRPEVHNPYFAIDYDEEEAASEALKLDDEFEL